MSDVRYKITSESDPVHCRVMQSNEHTQVHYKRTHFIQLTTVWSWSWHWTLVQLFLFPLIPLSLYPSLSSLCSLWPAKLCNYQTISALLSWNGKDKWISLVYCSCSGISCYALWRLHWSGPGQSRTVQVLMYLVLVVIIFRPPILPSAWLVG